MEQFGRLLFSFQHQQQLGQFQDGDFDDDVLVPIKLLLTGLRRRFDEDRLLSGL